MQQFLSQAKAKYQLLAIAEPIGAANCHSLIRKLLILLSSYQQ